MDDQIGQISDTGVLIPNDNHAFREHMNEWPYLILQLPQHPPYNIVMDAVRGLHGGLFKVEGKA